ncbi:hypothetical protein GCM10020219_026540 [Nonomuraea dietziae]
MDNGIPLPGEFGQRARDILAGRLQPVPARDAATVVILRDGARGPQVYLLRRKASMAFAAGAYVFPGGLVDPRDTDQAVAWAGPSPKEWGEVFNADEKTARGLVCAAVRETFEESGVLLAGQGEDAVVADTTGDDWEADRVALIDRSLAFADFLGKRGPGAPLRPAQAVGALDHARDRAQEVRHPLLRRGAPRGAAHP